MRWLGNCPASRSTFGDSVAGELDDTTKFKVIAGISSGRDHPQHGAAGADFGFAGAAVGEVDAGVEGAITRIADPGQRRVEAGAATALDGFRGFALVVVGALHVGVAFKHHHLRVVFPDAMNFPKKNLQHVIPDRS